METLNTKQFCPYCNFELQKIPLRKSKCPECKKFIYVKRRPNEKSKRLVTEEEAEKIESEWNVINEINRKDDILLSLKSGLKNSIEISESEFDKIYQQVENDLRNKWSVDPTEGDVLWGLAHELLKKAFVKKDFQGAKFLYQNMSYYIYESNKDGYELLKEAHKMELRFYKQLDVCKKIEISVCNDACEECQKNKNLILDIEEAIKSCPLPCKNCTNKTYGQSLPRCRCCYLSHFED